MNSAIPAGNKARIADPIDLLAVAWDQDTTGTGSIAIGTIEDTAHERKSALVLSSPAKTSGTADAAQVRLKITRRRAGEVTAAGLGVSQGEECWVYARVELSGSVTGSNQHQWMRGFVSTSRVWQLLRVVNDELRVHVDAGGFGGSSTVHATGVTLPVDEVFEVRVQYVSATSATANDGIFRVWVKRASDEDWVSALNVTNMDCDTQIDWVHLFSSIGPGGASDGSYNFVTRVLDVSGAWDGDDLSDDPAPFDQHAAYNRVDPTTLRVRLMLDPASYKDATHARLRWAEGSTVAADAGTTTEWVALTAYDDSPETMPITFLDATVPAASDVAFRIEVGDGADMTLQSEVYTVPAQPAASSTSPVVLHVGSCFDQYAAQHRELSALVSEVASLGWPLHQSFILGDRGSYDDLSINTYFGGQGPDTLGGITAYIKVFESDPHYPAFARTTPQINIEDDHPFNDIDGTWDGSSTLLSSLRPQWSGSSATQDDAYTALTTMFDDIWGPLLPGRAGEGLFYGSRTIGRVTIAYLDTRFLSDRAGHTCLGDTQIAWYRDLCQNLPASAPILLTLWQGSPNRWDVQADAPGSFALTEMRTVAQNRKADLPSYARYLDIYGDSHYGYSVITNIEGTGGADLADPRFVFQGVSSPMGQSLRSTAPNYTGATVLAAHDGTDDTDPNNPLFGSQHGGGTANADMARFTGVVLRIDPRGRIELKNWRIDEDGNNVLVLDETLTFPAAASPATSRIGVGLGLGLG